MSTTNTPFLGKVALVTGGTSGIGAVTAKMFGEQGASVVISGRREKEGTEIVEQISATGAKCLFVQCDVRKEDDIENLIAKTVSTFGRLDIALNNAGIEQTPLAPLADTSNESYHTIFDINVLGVWLSMKHEIRQMLKQGGGVIINTSSVAGHVGMPGASTYIASKHAVEGLTKSVALEVADKGIRINAVAPAMIATDMADRFTGGLDGEMAKAMAAMHPVGRMGKSEEVAAAILYLASPLAGFTTGISLPIDGGWLAK